MLTSKTIQDTILMKIFVEFPLFSDLVFRAFFEEIFAMHTLELWETGGGLDGVSEWQHLATLSL